MLVMVLVLCCTKIRETVLMEGPAFCKVGIRVIQDCPESSLVPNAKA